MRIVDMVKVDNLKLKEVYLNSQQDQHERVREFYKLSSPIVKEYSDYCTNKSYLDFNDMILQATRYIQKENL